MAKPFKLIANTLFFEVYQFACANEKGIKQTSKMKANSILKSIQHRCENDAQKSDAADSKFTDSKHTDSK